jgi:hypothetical protein
VCSHRFNSLLDREKGNAMKPRWGIWLMLLLVFGLVGCSKLDNASADGGNEEAAAAATEEVTSEEGKSWAQRLKGALVKDSEAEGESSTAAVDGEAPAGDESATDESDSAAIAASLGETGGAEVATEDEFDPVASTTVNDIVAEEEGAAKPNAAVTAGPSVRCGLIHRTSGGLTERYSWLTSSLEVGFWTADTRSVVPRKRLPKR